MCSCTHGVTAFYFLKLEQNTGFFFFFPPVGKTLKPGPTSFSHRVCVCETLLFLPGVSTESGNATLLLTVIKETSKGGALGKNQTEPAQVKYE